MKKLLLGLVLLLTIQSYGQISVSKKHQGKLKKIDIETFNAFKKTTTVFVLSDLYDYEAYDNVLKEVWTVTPYKIVNYKDYKESEYKNEKYSVAILAGLKKTFENSKGGEWYKIRFFLKLEMFYKKKGKYKTKKIAKIFFYPKDEIVWDVIASETKDEKVLNTKWFTDDVYFTYNRGFLKNYLQKINELITNNQSFWMYKSYSKPKLKELTKRILYIPMYVTSKFNALKGEDGKVENKEILELLKIYKYKYKIIDDEILSDKIIDNEDIYYLRYSRIVTERFIEIVNAKTGEVVYKEYKAGLLNYNIKEKNIKSLNKAIVKSSK